jgi:hypothetical protein
MRITVAVIRNDFPRVVQRLPKETGKVVQATLDLGKRTVEEGMRASTPGPSAPGAMPAIDTGELIGGLQTEMDSPTSGEFRSTAPHGIYVNYGTVNMAARPFMDPAAEVMREHFTREMKRLDLSLR